MWEVFCSSTKNRNIQSSPSGDKDQDADPLARPICNENFYVQGSPPSWLPP